jgi:hypothetical protein
MSRAKQGVGLAGLVLSLGLAGCGTPGAPQPPSLNLPVPVSDLSAVRAGKQVTLTWTMPRRTTDKLLLKNPMDVRVCRSENGGVCQPVGSMLKLAPSTAGTWTETLPAELAAGSPRVLRYAVRLFNANGRSAGLSNEVAILAGTAPAPLGNLTSELRKDGVALHWTAVGDDTAVRLHRTWLNVPKKPKKNTLSDEEPTEISLLVANGSQAGGAVDKTAELGQTYEYRAQHVARVEADGKTLELAGEFSAPLRVEVKDIFPPDAPTGLVAVAAEAADGTVSIDLSWEPNAEPDLAGYIVYRSENQGAWQRISPAEPVVGPAFHDAQVQAGHTYAYAATAVDHGGRESARSAAAMETAPAAQ